MTDRLTKEQRHRCMSKIHSKDTKPELKVRRWLWSHGYRYRLCVKSVPGSPDIVMRPYRTAIFVNGCFWHGHDVQLTIDNEQCTIEDSACCKIPKSNRGFWVEKIRRNQQRDERNYQILKDNGWQVIVDIHSRKVRQYVTEEDAELPAAAESRAGYGKTTAVAKKTDNTKL